MSRKFLNAIDPTALTGTKISALSAVTTPVGTDELVVNQGGTTKKLTLAQLNGYVDPLRSALVTAQAISGNSDTYITASRMVLPQSKMQAGTFFRARLVITKTAAGTATPVFTVRTGVNGTTADTSRHAYTGVAQTGAIDTGYLDILATFRNPGASCILATWTNFTHDLASTGFANATRDFQGSTISSAFDSTTASMGIGLSINPGASAAWTIQQCTLELLNLAD